MLTSLNKAGCNFEKIEKKFCKLIFQPWKCLSLKAISSLFKTPSEENNDWTK